MRDEKDTQTKGDLLPAKRGRPVRFVDHGPMTGAERMRVARAVKAERLSVAARYPTTCEDIGLLADALVWALKNRKLAQAGRVAAELAARLA